MTRSHLPERVSEVHSSRGRNVQETWGSANQLKLLGTCHYVGHVTEHVFLQPLRGVKE